MNWAVAQLDHRGGLNDVSEARESLNAGISIGDIKLDKAHDSLGI